MNIDMRYVYIYIRRRKTALPATKAPWTYVLSLKIYILESRAGWGKSWMSTKIGSHQTQSPEDNTRGGRTHTSASRYNHSNLIIPARSLGVPSRPRRIYIIYIYTYIYAYIYMPSPRYRHAPAAEQRRSLVRKPKWNRETGNML